MSGGFDFLVSSVEERYDYLSARSVAREALSLAGLDQSDKYSAGDLQKFADALSSLGHGHLDKIWGKLGVAPTGQAAPEPAPAAEPEKADEKKASGKKAKAEEESDDDDDKKPEKKAEKKAEKKKGGKKK